MIGRCNMLRSSVRRRSGTSDGINPVRIERRKTHPSRLARAIIQGGCEGSRWRPGLLASQTTRAGPNGSCRSPHAAAVASWRIPSSGCKEQTAKIRRPPGRSIVAACAIKAACWAASVCTSRGRFKCSTSGWRRTVPVAVQGASSSTASTGVGGVQVEASACTIVASTRNLDRFSRSLAMRPPSRSSAVTWAPVVASCAALPPGAAQRSTTVSPRCAASRRAGRLAAASCTHQSPSA